jgi:CRISPR-associated protein Csx1
MEFLIVRFAMKLLIAPWGKPFEWRGVKYTYSGKTKKSKDPLALIKEIEKPDKIVIVVLDTLADTLLKNGIDNYSHNWLSNYSYIKTEIQRKVSDFCQKELGFVPDEVIISYGFGEFIKTKFLGNAKDFYYDVFKEFSFLFAELEINREIEVVFDATHGINWITILTYRALREILEILSYFYSVNLKVLNSDPFVREGADLLNINIIEETKILPRISVYKDDRRPIEPYNGLEEDKEKKKVGKEINDFFKEIFGNNRKYSEYRDEILLFLGSFYFALPVALLSYIPDPEDLRTKIEKISDEFEKNIQIDDRVEKVQILRKLEFRESFANFSKAYLISSVLGKLRFRKSYEIPLSEIEELKGKVFGKLAIECNRIDVEIKEVSELKDKLSEEYQIYAKIKFGSFRDEIDKRNFFAHAGFEYNSIELKKDICNGKKDEIYIKIRDQSIEKIKQLIIQDLQQI